MRVSPLFAGLTLAVGASLVVVPASAEEVQPASCERVLPEPVRAKDVAQAKGVAAAVSATDRKEALAIALESFSSSAESAGEALEDPTLWLDSCGKPFYREPKVSKAELASVPTGLSGLDPAEKIFPYEETFKLNSNLGAPKTIYINFEGGEVKDTGWNVNHGDLTAEAYSEDELPEFSLKELRTIQRTYAAVAEDYAPFAVNVTTERPASSALAKDGINDAVYGLAVYVTQNSPIQKSCLCGGQAYVDIAGASSTGASLKYYSPAWAFADTLQYSWAYMSEAIAHEAGHNLGLDHDGFHDKAYHEGSEPWAPIMGGGYGQPLTQWSKGEYAGATNKEDDLAVIAKTLAYRSDDFQDGQARTLTQLSNQQSSPAAIVAGVIERTGDADAFSFAAAGPTVIKVKPALLKANLDVKAVVVKTNGTVVAEANPVTEPYRAWETKGLDAELTVDLPAEPQRYRLIVAGTGQGSPTTTGYSAYGSLGFYEVSLSTSPAADNLAPEPPRNPPPPVERPLTLTAATYTGLKPGKAFSARPSAKGGNGSYRWRAEKLPPGIALSSSGVLSGSPRAPGLYKSKVTVVSGSKQSGVSFTFRVAAKLSSPTKSRLPEGKVGKRYSKALRFAGGEKNYSWTKTGRVPRGLKISYPKAGGSTVKLKGRPAKAGTYRFKLRVKDGAGDTYTRVFVVRVKK